MLVCRSMLRRILIDFFLLLVCTCFKHSTPAIHVRFASDDRKYLNRPSINSHYVYSHGTMLRAVAIGTFCLEMAIAESFSNIIAVCSTRFNKSITTRLMDLWSQSSKSRSEPSRSSSSHHHSGRSGLLLPSRAALVRLPTCTSSQDSRKKNRIIDMRNA